MLAASLLALVAKLAFVVAVSLTAPGRVHHTLLRFDAGWYRSVVERGYSLPATGNSNLAFFPLLPTLATPLTWLGMDAGDALLVIAWVCTVAAAALIAAVGLELHGATVGITLAALWLVAPRSHVLAMGYSESLFTALAAGFLLLVLRGRLGAAALVCALAGLSRPTGAVLVVLLAVACLLRVRGAASAHRRREELRGLGCLVLAGAGLLGYWSYVAWKVGDPSGYLTVQEQWGSHTVGPWETLVEALRALVVHAMTWDFRDVIAIHYLLVLGLVVLLVRKREHWLLVGYAVLGVLLVSCQGGYFHSKSRLLLPFFPVWVPVAMALQRVPRWLQGTLLVAAVAASAVWGADLAQLKRSP